MRGDTAQSQLNLCSCAKLSHMTATFVGFVTGAAQTIVFHNLVKLVAFNSLKKSIALKQQFGQMLVGTVYKSCSEPSGLKIFFPFLVAGVGLL